MDEFYTLINKYFDQKKLKNNRYSLRAFAHHLTLEPSQVSKILRRKIKPRIKTIELILAKIQVEGSLKDSIIARIHQDLEKKCRAYKLGKNIELDQKSTFHFPFNEYEDILIFLVLNVGQSFESEEQISWLSDLTGLTTFDVKNSLRSLEEKQIVLKKNQIYVQNLNNIVDNYSSSNHFRKNIQRKFLEIAIDKMQTLPVEDRLNGALTLTIDSRLIPKLKRKIDSFLREINGWAQAESQTHNQLCNLVLALYPLSIHNKGSAV